MCLLAAVLLSGTDSRAEFQPWSENVFAHIKQEYGDEAEERMRFVEKFIIDNQDIPDMEKVVKTNQVSNHLPWIADANHWKESDYWATPLETITTFGGDCRLEVSHHGAGGQGREKEPRYALKPVVHR